MHSADLVLTSSCSRAREIIRNSKCAPVGTPMGSHCGNKWSSLLALDSKVGEIDQLLLPRCLQDNVLESLHNKQDHQGVERASTGRRYTKMYNYYKHGLICVSVVRLDAWERAYLDYSLVT